MGIIEELLENFESVKVDHQVKELCDKIFDEEKDKIKHLDILPKGPNIFLALEVPGRLSQEISFLCLEREAQATYIVTVWSKSQGLKPILRTKVWEIKEYNKPDKILIEYAKKIKLMRGE